MSCDTVINPVTQCAEPSVLEAIQCNEVTPSQAEQAGTTTIIGGTESEVKYTGTYTITQTCNCPYTGSSVVTTETATSDLSQENANSQAYAKALAASKTVAPICSINYSLLQSVINTRRTSPYTFTLNTVAELITAFAGIDQTLFYQLNSDLTIKNGLRYSAAYFTPTNLDTLVVALYYLRHKYTGYSFINPLTTTDLRAQLVSKSLWYSDNATAHGVWNWLALASRGAGTYTQSLNLTISAADFPYGGYISLHPIGPPYVAYFPAWPEWAKFYTDVIDYSLVKTYDWPNNNNFLFNTFQFFRSINSATFVNDQASPFYGSEPKVNSAWTTPGDVSVAKNNGIELTDFPCVI